MNHFCTYFDSNYLPRGLALYESLRETCISFSLWALCLDGACYRHLSGRSLPGLQAISLEQLESFDPELARVRPTRSRVEYYFTCTPSLARYALAQVREGEIVTYLDADLFFFSGPSPVFEEVGERSVAIIPHRFSNNLRELASHGIYNVGWVSFRKDEPGARCLGWWRERCLEWCYDRVEGERFADQKYLDGWPRQFDGVAVIEHPGANLALWNVANWTLDWDGERLHVDGRPLIFFHFHHLRHLQGRLYNMNLSRYGVRSAAVLRRRVYAPYLARLEALRAAAGCEEALGAIARGSTGIRDVAKSVLWRDYMLAPRAGRAER